MLKDINYENYFFAEIRYCSINCQNETLFCQQVNEGTIIPIQDCFSFHIVIAGEHFCSVRYHLRKHLCSVSSLSKEHTGQQMCIKQEKELTGHDKINVTC